MSTFWQFFLDTLKIFFQNIRINWRNVDIKLFCILIYFKFKNQNQLINLDLFIKNVIFII